MKRLAIDRQKTLSGLLMDMCREYLERYRVSPEENEKKRDQKERVVAVNTSSQDPYSNYTHLKVSTVNG